MDSTIEEEKISVRLLIEKKITALQDELKPNELSAGEVLFQNGSCQILSQSAEKFELAVSDPHGGHDTEMALVVDNDGSICAMEGKKTVDWNRVSYACLQQVLLELQLLGPKKEPEHKQYSRQGMIKRVITERRQKADKAEYRIKWASNIHGDHILTNENGVRYTVFLRDIEQETGYSNSLDAKFNKLGTSKHIMFAYNMLKKDPTLDARLDKTYPFVEVFCDPLNDNRITWHYPHTLRPQEEALLERYFGGSQFVGDEQLPSLLGLLQDVENNARFLIRPEVHERIDAAFEKQMLAELSNSRQLDMSVLKADLFDYQKEGIRFAVFKKAAIIADEMGLGKTLQAIGAAILKKDIFGFKRTLVVCPASLKEQWKREIEKFSDEKALVISGNARQREKQYTDTEHYFHIVNYETVLRDRIAMNRSGTGFLIMDEAQRAKNYETKTASSLKNLIAQHKLVITGTPIENKLLDIYSIMSILDPYFLGPLWEFSYQHCLFDPTKHNKINGYYDLRRLNEKLDAILIRREKRKVMDQLPSLTQTDIPVGMTPLQAEYHASYARGISVILRKKFMTPYDMQRMQILLASMRMVCDSTYLIDEETNDSPKLDELEHILLEKLDVPNSDRKIIIFSEWVKVHKLIGRMLRKNNIGFVELNGSVPVKLRGDLIRKFEDNTQYKIFLSTEAGGSGLNLQVADTVINFELPWNPAKKNQRIGRIDRLGQKSSKLSVFNLITTNSIETRIASGILVKQSLFDGVLSTDNNIDRVDFTTKGRSQFIQQLEEMLTTTETEPTEQVAAEAPSEPTTPTTGELPFDPTTSEQSETQPTVKRNPAEEKELQEKQLADVEKMEEVMNHGLQFLAGMFKMSTGKDLGVAGSSIDVNKETGEVTMKFKMPMGEKK